MRGPLTVDTTTTDTIHLMEIVAQGALHSSVTEEHACFWFDGADGTVVSLIWPEGSSAVADPLRVLDAGGNVIATTGDEGVAFGGSFLERKPGCAGPGSTTFVAGLVTVPPQA
jgi:hypothetical protein